MQEDLYNDSPDKPSGDAGDKPQSNEAGDGSETSILPKSFFSGKDLKPGDKCDVEIVAIHDNDVEVRGCDSSDTESDNEDSSEGGQEEPGDSSGPPSAAGSMSSMME